MSEQYGTFDEMRARLEQIVEEVNAEGVTLDEALSLYEEAVKLGLSACDLSEQDALEAYEAEQAASGAKAAAEAATAAGAEDFAGSSPVEAGVSGERASEGEQTSAASGGEAAGSR